MVVVGKKFSVDFEQATEINGNTQILVQSEGEPVEKASVEQLGLALINENIVPSTKGNYPKMSVGFAENIVGDGSATSEVFSFRPTAGENRNTLNDGAVRIKVLKGSSVVVNQIAKVRTNTITTNGISVTNDGVKSIVVGTAEANTNISLATASIAANHRCLLCGCPSNGSASTFYFSDGLGNRDYGQGVIFTTTGAHSDTWMNLTIVQGTKVDFVIYPCLYDLTQMFGAEEAAKINSVAEFYQRMPIVENPTAYNAGEIVNGNYKAIKTTGFNQWDEQWKNGYYNMITGAFVADSNYIANTNPIRVLPSTKYYIKQSSTQYVVNYYDINNKFISREAINRGDSFTTPSNAVYLNFAYGGTSYNNDVCLHICWSEYSHLEDTYKPYKPFERNLSWIHTIKDNEGNLLFEDGMKQAGSVRDEIRFNSTTQKWEAVKRVGVADLGKLKWTNGWASSDSKFYTQDLTFSGSSTNYITAKYERTTSDAVNMPDKTFIVPKNSNVIIIYDSAYTNAATFKAAMQGVMLNYELAEPIVTEITENVNFDYDVSDYGTEELIVADGVESAPLAADIVYEPNVLGFIKQQQEIFTRLAALEAAMASLTTANVNIE